MSVQYFVISKISFILIMSLFISSCATHSQNQINQNKTALLIPEEIKHETKIIPISTPISSKKASISQELTSELLYDLLVAEIALQRNDYEQSFEKYYATAQATQDARLARKATRVTLFSKNEEQTFKSVALWSKIEPNNNDVQQIYASSLISQKKDEQAIVYLKKIISLSDTTKQGLKQVMSIIDTIDDQMRAIHIFTQITVPYHNQTMVKLYQVKLAIKFSSYPKAEGYLDEILIEHPKNINALRLKVELLNKQKKRTQAITILQKIIQELPDNVGLRLELTRLLIAEKNYIQAEQQIHLLAKKELSPEVLFAISLLSIEISNTDDAKNYLKRLYTYKLYASESAYFIGQIEVSENNYSQAEIWFKRVESGKYSFEAYQNLVLVYTKQKKFKQAFKLLEHGNVGDGNIVNGKQEIEILHLKAEVYSQMNNYHKAYAVYNKALVLDPDNHDIRYGRAMLADKFGYMDLLEKDLHIILKKNPDDAHVLNALGYILADKTSRYKEAEQYIKRALALKPDDVAILDSMGWILYKMGQSSQALSFLKRAYNKDADPEIAAHYGEVLWATGQTRKATQVWQKALKKNPEHSLLKTTMTHYLKDVD